MKHDMDIMSHDGPIPPIPNVISERVRKPHVQKTQSVCTKRTHPLRLFLPPVLPAAYARAFAPSTMPCPLAFAVAAPLAARVHSRGHWLRRPAQPAWRRTARASAAPLGRRAALRGAAALAAAAALQPVSAAMYSADTSVDKRYKAATDPKATLPDLMVRLSTNALRACGKRWSLVWR